MQFGGIDGLADHSHQRQVLGQPGGLSLGGLGGTDHAPVRVVQHARFHEFAMLGDGGVEPAEVAEPAGEGETVEHLRHPGLDDVALAVGAPVAGGQRLLEAVGDGFVLDGLREVHVLALVHVVFELRGGLLGHFGEQLPEERAEQTARQVQALLALVVAVVLRRPVQLRVQHPVHHLPQEVRFLDGLLALTHRHVRQHVQAQHFFRLLYSVLFQGAGSFAPPCNLVQCLFLRVYDTRLLNGWFDGIHHLDIAQALADVLNHVFVTLVTESLEHNAQWDVGFDRGYLHLDSVATFVVVFRCFLHFDFELARWSLPVLLV